MMEHLRSARVTQLKDFQVAASIDTNMSLDMKTTSLNQKSELLVACLMSRLLSWRRRNFFFAHIRLRVTFRRREIKAEIVEINLLTMQSSHK
jgi:hypothetical protein